jgi:DNA helicase-2/ATP-dependent DNA helicase PcrA
MNKWEQVRRKAREFHAEVCDAIKSASGSSDGEISAKLLIETAGNLRGIELKGYPADSPWLKDCKARSTGDKIIYNRDIEEWLAIYYQAHEFAHIEQKHGARECTAEDINCEATESKIPLGVHRVEGYGPHERIECEANIFAREFLLPCDKLKRWFVEEGLNAEQIADRTGMGIEMVCHQLAYALLTPEILVGDENPDDADEKGLTLDEFQTTAAQVPEGPQMLEAGPGTGKTRTLIGRVLWLLTQGVKAENILILTFSNKAADELRQRVKRFAPEESNLIEVETFHSFGLQLLRKHGTKIGLSAKPPILDPVDALFTLERFLPELKLDYYQNLYDPAMYLGDILKAISRAKDENVSLVGYRKLGELQSAAAKIANDADGKKVAAKVLEVAGVYEFYDEYLRHEKILDFGDLICRSIELLNQHKKIRSELRGIHQHILVDEYQDVNRASGLLLKELAGDGRGLWAVADIRQSIHRWRGATTANIRRFKEDFPLAKVTLPLKKNYRSKPDIVDIFAAYAPTMKATLGGGFHDWEKDRTNDGVTVKFEVATDQETEAVGIAREIKRLQIEEGIPLKQQAIICRSHTTLARIAKILEREEVPVLYLGDFFERPEVRDMLSLISLACEANGRGLVRVARFPEYNIPLEDVRHLHRFAQEKNVPFPQALKLAEDSEKMSPAVKEKIALLAGQLEDLCHGRSAWKTLTRYLFIKSHYLKPFLADASVRGQQQRLALYQLLQFAHNHLGAQAAGGIDPKKSLLKYIRRLEMYGDEKQLRQSSEWADGIDAVRIITIHASKGLEFRAVFLPALATSYFPSPNRHQPCPPPAELIAEENDDWRVEEEECLFFVALSRARDYICISHALRYGKMNRKGSAFLQPIAGLLPITAGGVIWDDAGGFAKDNGGKLVPPAFEIPKVFEIRELEVYLGCPRKYLYEFVLGLSGKRDDTAYLQFHKCVYDAVRQVKTEHKQGTPASEQIAQQYLEDAWDKRGPKDHYLERIYKEAARAMVTNAVKRIRAAANLISTDLEVTLSEGKVILSLDHAEIGDANDADSKMVFLQRFRTGRPTKKEREKPIYGLLLKAVADAYPEAEPRLQILYLGADYAEDVPLNGKQIDKKAEEYNNAMLGIKNGEFPPTPDDHKCPRCPHYHICPAAEDSVR